jgi:hypothetical protein
MQLYAIAKLLADAGLAPPALQVLTPNHENYTALLLQPKGDIEADANGVRNADKAAASQQHAAFLSDAATEKVDIAITPEYSTPWRTLSESIQRDVFPGPGALWVIGAESTTVSQLNAFIKSVSGVATVLHEPLTEAPGRFLDPVLYLFQTFPTSAGTPPVRVVVIQFKTHPMGDDRHFEINGLHCGTRVYYFGDGTTTLRLATILCSDAFALRDTEAQQLYDRTLLIHIQLNPKPRQEQYREYRSRLMRLNGDQTELLCLNWAKDVHECFGGECKPWNNISGTAWYLRPDKFDREDTTLISNHRKGLYYTRLKADRCHALFFAYEPAVFKIVASKVAHIGVVASSSRRRGPQLSDTRYWDAGSSRWVSAATVDDGFSAVVHVSGDAESDLVALAGANPFAAERALALAAGCIDNYAWHEVDHLDSCAITTSEVIKRVTACHDTDELAEQFRVRRLRNAHRLVTALKGSLPPALADLNAGFTVDWSRQSPHTNIVSQTSKRATGIYLGDEHTVQSVEAVAARAADHIGQWEKAPDAIVEGCQRLMVWYRNAEGNDVRFGGDRYVQYDQSRTDSPVDIGRDE